MRLVIPIAIALSLIKSKIGLNLLLDNTNPRLRYGMFYLKYDHGHD